MGRLLLCAMALLLSLLGATPASAQRVMHRVRFGESLSDISRHYYGTPAHRGILRLANGLGLSRKLKAGERVRVPTAWTYRLKNRSTVKTAAKHLLGDTRRWPALALFNNLGTRPRLAAGSRLTVPFVLEHLVAPGQSMDEVAQLFYGDKKLAGLIALYNFTSNPQPKAGTRLLIPVGKVRILARRMEQLVQTRLLGMRRSLPSGSREALQEANAMLRRGEYWAVPLRLVRLLAQQQVSDEHLVEVYRLLGSAYVAVGREELATRAFSEVLKRRPGYALDNITTSPKVIRALEAAKSELKQGKRRVNPR